MEFRATERFLELFPETTIALVMGEISSARAELQAAVGRYQQEATASLATSGLDTSTLSTHPHVAAWRDAYQKFGVKAKSHKPTHEALCRRVLKGEGWPAINPVVDIYLTNQAAHILPHGGYDCHALQGDVTLDISGGDEPFEPLGGGTEMTAPGEVVYRDASGVITRRWNYRDSERCKITDSTKSFMLVIEAPSQVIPPAAVEAAAQDLVRRFEECFNGRFAYDVQQMRKVPC